MTDNEKKTLQQALRETWMNALGLLSQAEGEVARAGQRVLDAVGLSAEGEGRSIAADLGELAEQVRGRVRRNQEAFEHRVDEGVKAAIARVKGPFVDQLASLRGRIEKLSRRVEALQHKARRGAPGDSEKS